MNGSFSNYFSHSEIGPSHLKTNTPNQDAYAYKQFDWGEVIAVSDGVGSRRHSDIGSKAACKASIELGCYWNKHPQATESQLLEQYHHFWIKLLKEIPANDCCCTCMFVVHCHGKILTAKIGDGVLASINTDHKIKITKDKNDEFSFSNQTLSLSQKHKLSHWIVEIEPRNNYSAFVLMTDGISDDLLVEEEKNFIEKLFTYYHSVSQLQAEKEIEQWLKAWPVPNHQDDKTLACMYSEDKPSEV